MSPKDSLHPQTVSDLNKSRINPQKSGARKTD